MDDVKQFSSDKILRHLEHVCAWHRGENVPPITMEIDLTNRCNNDCPGCIGVRKRLVDFKTPLRIIAQVAEFGVKALTFTGGGEPLLHPQLSKCVRYAHNLGLDVAVITNGSLMTKKIAQQIKPFCVWIRVSLDAHNHEMRKAIHGVDDFKKAVQGVRYLVEAKGGSTVGVGYLTGKKTKKGMLPATKLCKRLGVNYIQFRPFHYEFTAIDKELKACKLERTKNFDVLYSKHKYDSMRNGDFGRFYKVCYGQQFASVIAADGKMYLCCHFRGMEKYCLGDLYKDSLRKIWNSKKRQRAITNIGNFIDCVPLCRCNTFNQILWEIRQPKEHENFL